MPDYVSQMACEDSNHDPGTRIVPRDAGGISKKKIPGRNIESDPRRQWTKECGFFFEVLFRIFFKHVI